MSAKQKMRCAVHAQAPVFVGQQWAIAHFEVHNSQSSVSPRARVADVQVIAIGCKWTPESERTRWHRDIMVAAVRSSTAHKHRTLQRVCKSESSPDKIIHIPGRSQ